MLDNLKYTDFYMIYDNMKMYFLNLFNLNIDLDLISHSYTLYKCIKKFITFSMFSSLKISPSLPLVSYIVKTDTHTSVCINVQCTSHEKN